MDNFKLTDSQIAALQHLRYHGGCILVTGIPEKTGRDIFDNIVPGISIFKKLDARGMVNITEEEPQADLDGFCFTPMIELTDKGLAALSAAK